MIKITKSPNIPAKLASEGVAETKALCLKYDASPTAYSDKNIDGATVLKMEFEQKIYGDGKVKEQLIEDQHEKCCFCESVFTKTSYGDVEHFRPKGGFKQKNNDKISYPGYYWLAYSWGNLLFSCQLCNQRYKKNLFPLEEPTLRANNHHADVSKETPLLINPVTDVPEAHIGFRDEVAFGKTPKGDYSIKAYGLQRFDDERAEYLRYIEYNHYLSTLDPSNQKDIDDICRIMHINSDRLIEMVDKAKKIMKNAAKDEAKYAAMIRAKYPHLPK